MRLQTSLVPLFLVVTLVFSLAENVHAKPGMGISSYQIDITVQESVGAVFVVGVIHNTGNVSLNLSLYWVQTYGNYSLPVTVYPMSKVLPPEEVCEVSVEVKKDARSGYYNGSVEVEAVPMQTGSGNPTAIGGSFNIEVTVVPLNMTEEPPTNETQPPQVPQKSRYPSIIIIGLIVFCLGYVILVIYIKRRRKRCENE